MRPLPALAATLLLPVLLAACSTEEDMRAIDPAGRTPTSATAAPATPPSAVPAADGPVQTRGLVTVLDDGDGPELCLGAVAESYPPQCSGLPMRGWDWAEHPEHESASGVRWGGFFVTGTFDGTTFTVTAAIPAALYDTTPTPPTALPGTPCEEPEGGWQVVDPPRTTPETLDATLAAAAALPGYATAWLDQSPNPASGRPQPDEGTMNDPLLTIVNVAVTADPAAAEEALRETWGGMLCVSQARYTERELDDLQRDLQATVPGILSSGSTTPDTLAVDVVHDDGSIQAWADAEHGPGLVEVTSALVPAE